MDKREYSDDFELPGIQPVVPEKRVPDTGYRPEVGDAVVDRIRREDGSDSVGQSSVPDIDNVINRRKGNNSPSGFVESPAAYIAKAKQDLDETKRMIARLAEMIGAFDDQSLAARLWHHSEYRRLQHEYDEAIREERRLEETLRISAIGESAGGI